MIVGLGLAATGIGCGGMNPFVMIPALISGNRAEIPAEFPLTPPAKKQEAKVVVIVSSKLGQDPDLAGVDRMLNAELISVLDARLKEHEEKVQVLKMPRLDEYKAQNPNWKTVHPYDLGKTVAEGADYVIDVEIVELELYKPGGRGQWLQGRANVLVSAFDLSKPVREPAYRQDFTFEFPQTGEEEVQSKAQISAFRMRFVRRIASDISIKFAPTSPENRHRMN
jgi:hypothetical protein